ncbi:TRAP transporter substrate-binding protein [Salipiger sp. PrR002]|uniref:TRAP transporter substrate-binding protein n=1 Tax=Salipiger sp. PrR002 TaxID=2706489 RepID=UPI0013BBFA78|nr:TRAP transporter substrate-binding protein [Salipiger sp. PrR002]NDW00211.1 TRAP transporter substrate-binding protein [Salipiger sp. PrR002]NDW56780.1 TRAP transporter substrate-binding protein [Salipiger sp. PrR004]
MKRILLTTAALLSLVSTGARAETSWDLPTAYGAGVFHTEVLQSFADEVEALTDGDLKITVHLGASLYKAPEIKRAVQSGQVQAGEVLLSNFSNENPLFGVDSVPFLAVSYDDAKRLDAASRPALDALLADQGMMLLYTVPWQGQNLYSEKPISDVSDLAGTKMRAYNPATSELATLLKAQPTTIQLSEMGQALATGMVENLLNSSAGGVSAKFYEQISYLYTVNAWLPKNGVLVSKAAFDALPEKDQQAVLKAAAEAETLGWQMSEAKDDEYLDTLQAEGMTIEAPTQALTDGLKAAGDAMLEDWLETSGPEGAALIEAYHAGK